MIVKDCVNTWCKYNGGFYCQQNCGSYVPNDTMLKDMNRTKFNVNDCALFHNQELLCSGAFERIVMGHETDIVKSVNYDWNTICIQV